MNFNNNRDDDSDELWDDSSSESAWQDRSDSSGRSDGAESSDSSDMSDMPDVSDDPHMSDFDQDADEEEVPVAKAPKKKQRRFFGIGFGSSEERKDYFNSEDDEEEEEVKPKPKVPRLDPEDPDYWMGDEPDIPDIMPRPRKFWKWWLAAIVVMIGLLVWGWLWVFTPYVEEAVQYGYVENIRKEGTALTTFEGVMIPYREINDTTRVYREDFRFSVATDSTAARLKGMMLGCIPVKVEYRKYHVALPWRGNQKIVVVKADTANPALILPPEFR